MLNTRQRIGKNKARKNRDVEVRHPCSFSNKVPSRMVEIASWECSCATKRFMRTSMARCTGVRWLRWLACRNITRWCF